MSKDIDLLRHLPLAERVAVRALVRDIILATDMGRHAALVQVRGRAGDAEKCSQFVRNVFFVGSLHLNSRSPRPYPRPLNSNVRT